MQRKNISSSDQAARVHSAAKYQHSASKFQPSMLLVQRFPEVFTEKVKVSTNELVSWSQLYKNPDEPALYAMKKINHTLSLLLLGHITVLCMQMQPIVMVALCNRADHNIFIL